MKRQSGRHPLEIKGLTKSYDALKVVDNFTASVSRGEHIALMGRNGTGKTTLLKSLLHNATGYIDDSERSFPSTPAPSYGATKSPSVTSRRITPIPSPTA